MRTISRLAVLSMALVACSKGRGGGPAQSMDLLSSHPQLFGAWVGSTQDEVGADHDSQLIIYPPDQSTPSEAEAYIVISYPTQAQWDASGGVPAYPTPALAVVSGTVRAFGPIVTFTKSDAPFYTSWITDDQRLLPEAQTGSPYFASEFTYSIPFPVTIDFGGESVMLPSQPTAARPR